MRRPSPIVGVFLTVFFDILSFGVVIPDVQLRAENLTAGVPANLQGVLIGSLIAVYSVAQLIFGPPLGRWSDRVGRRPVLIVTSVLAIVASVLYAFALNWPVMAVSRFVLGMAGANMGVAYAYIADVTKPEERAASMGKIGLAFGLGFVLGPPVGAWLISAGGGEPGLLGAVSAVFASGGSCPTSRRPIRPAVGLGSGNGSPERSAPPDSDCCWRSSS
jgi:MFS transporter, DHA1 family, tetracycline resistance protein